MGKTKSPSYPLCDVKDLINNNNVFINSNAYATAFDDFGFGPDQIKKCLCKLKRKNFHKTEPHSRYPNTMMDYYKAPGIMKGVDLYTHIYIDKSGMLIVSSFKEL